MELKIGDTVSFDGLEFVIYSASSVRDLEGRAITLHGLDPQRAMRHMADQEGRRRLLDAQAGVAELIPQMKKALEE